MNQHLMTTQGHCGPTVEIINGHWMLYMYTLSRTRPSSNDRMFCHLRHSSLIISVRTWSGEISPQHTTSEEGSYVQRLLGNHVFNNNWIVTLIILSFSLIQRTIDY